MSDSVTIVDSPIWTTPADPDHPAFAHLKVDPEELAKIVNDPEFQAKVRARIAERIKPYQTKVTWRSLMTPLD